MFSHDHRSSYEVSRRAAQRYEEMTAIAERKAAAKRSSQKEAGAAAPVVAPQA